MTTRWFIFSVTISMATACMFARSGMSPPFDDIHKQLQRGNTYPVLPQPVTTENNAFVQDDLLRPLPALTGNNRSLLENLGDLAKREPKTDLCYWTRQGLPPPRGSGPSLFHPSRGYYDVSDGENDQDIEWVQAYGEVALARLSSRIKPNGPVVGAMCAMGARIASRRCENGASIKAKCIPAIINGTIQWPMAVSIWKIGHPELQDAVTDWRASAETGHLPNIEWDAHTAGTAPARPWKGAMPTPGETNPEETKTSANRNPNPNQVRPTRRICQMRHGYPARLWDGGHLRWLKS